jgi:mannose-6-phosphate isomerase-like protein (cupin superfamily)
MGKLVDYRNAPRASAGRRAAIADITGSEGVKLKAEYIVLEPGGAFERTVAPGCDQHLFVLSGSATVTVSAPGSDAQALKYGSFVLVQEGRAFVLEAGVPCEILSVLTPPPGTHWPVPGFSGGMKVISMHNETVDDVAAAKKQRIYLATHGTCGSERAHGMIVKYVPETETTLHMHPDAESLFVFLEGETALSVNGERVTGRFGHAAFFPCGDKHDLHGTAGNSYFLEFHVPGRYTTVR